MIPLVALLGGGDLLGVAAVGGGFAVLGDLDDDVIRALVAVDGAELDDVGTNREAEHAHVVAVRLSHGAVAHERVLDDDVEVLVDDGEGRAVVVQAHLEIGLGSRLGGDDHGLDCDAVVVPFALDGVEDLLLLVRVAVAVLESSELVVAVVHHGLVELGEGFGSGGVKPADAAIDRAHAAAVHVRGADEVVDVDSHADFVVRAAGGFDRVGWGVEVVGGLGLHDAGGEAGGDGEGEAGGEEEGDGGAGDVHSLGLHGVVHSVFRLSVGDGFGGHQR